MDGIAIYDGKVERLEREIASHYAANVTPEFLRLKRHALMREGYIKLTELLPRTLMEAVRRDVKQIVDCAARRIDILVEQTGNSPRKMSTVNFADITKYGKLVPDLYYARPMRQLLNNIAGHPVINCDFESERLTITKQEKPGDTHGWHWGDYQYALIFIVEAPPIDAGGMLQCVPHTIWNKQDPQVHRLLCENPIRTYHHETGDIYFFRTDTTLHRTYPLERECTRIILNFTFGGPDDLNKSKTHETMAAIYDFE
jgi:hypothetical protein